MADRRHCLLSILVCLGACIAFASNPGDTPPTSSAQRLDFLPPTANSLTLVRGTITLVDPVRKLIVLQDDDKVTPLRMDKLVPELRIGDAVELEGKLGPFVSAMPDFPNNAAKSAVLAGFETPTNQGNATLSRLRGILHPPATGDYIFWIASDDSSELWLSEHENPGGAREIAHVEIGRFTEAREWARYPSQESQKIHLEAGRSYYLEALSQNTSGRDCLAVAWQPPGAERDIIGGASVSPWREGGNKMDSTAHGVSWELWTNYFPRDLSVLQIADKNILRCRDFRIVKRTKGEMPTLLPLEPGAGIDGKAAFRLVDLVGRVEFASKLGGSQRLELKWGKSRITARFGPAVNFDAVIPNNSLVRVRGVFEPGYSYDSDAPAGMIWVNDRDDLSWLDAEENWSVVESSRQEQLTASNPDLTVGRIIHAQGRIVSKEAPNVWRLQGKDTFEGYLSADRTNWLSAGVPVEIDMSNTVVAGLAIASYRASEPAVAEFDHISGLSKSLSGVDIGKPPYAGSFEFRTNALRLRGSGDNIWGGSDQCYFVYQPIEGNFELIAHLSELNCSDPQAKAALIVRQSISSDSSWAAVVLTPADRAGLQSRRESGKSAAGPLSLQTEKWIKLVRRQSFFLVRAQADSLQVGQTLDVLGRVGWQGQMLALDDARFRVVSNKSSPLPNVPSPAQSSGDLHDVQIGELASEADVAQKTPHAVNVRIRGVVTFNGPIGDQWLTFIQDKSGPAKIDWKSDSLRNGCHAGDWVEVTGVPLLSGLLPTISANGVTSPGAGEVPEPIRFSMDESKRSGVLGQWSEIEGVVRSVDEKSTLLIATRAGECKVRSVTSYSVKNLVDSRVRVRGVFWPTPDPTLLLPSGHCVEIIEAAPENPFSIPAFPIHSLESRGNALWLSRRVKLAGIVTCCRDNFIIVEDESGGARVETASTPQIKSGDAVEVVGFPIQSEFGFGISGALVRLSGRHDIASPERLSPDSLPHPPKNGVLVTTEAVLLEQHARRGMQTLDVQAGQRVFRASLPEKDGALPAITPGSRIKLSGVLVMQREVASIGGAQPVVGSLELLLRDSADVAVLERPPWWSWKYTVATVGLIAAIMVGALLWIRTLRKRVEERTRELRETMGKLENETRISATLAERDRLAGEIHDSVEQGLSAIVMQMEAAAKLVDQPEEIARYVSMAKNMAGFSRTEVQHAIWHLQSPLLENSDLPTALARVAQDISAGDTARVTVQTSGTVVALPSTVEHHLLRIAQEAITNAVKHGNAKKISLALQYHLATAVLTVRDDGLGFVPEAVSTEAGHFGLQGMRARALKMDAAFTVESQPGQGTLIQVVVPCKNHHPQGAMYNGTTVQ